MIGPMIVAVLLCAGAAAAVVALLDLVFRFHARRYSTVIATGILDDWQAHLDAMEPERREAARMAPPASVLAAMRMLPSQSRSSRFSRSR